MWMSTVSLHLPLFYVLSYQSIWHQSEWQWEMGRRRRCSEMQRHSVERKVHQNVHKTRNTSRQMYGGVRRTASLSLEHRRRCRCCRRCGWCDGNDTKHVFENFWFACIYFLLNFSLCYFFYSQLVRLTRQNHIEKIKYFRQYIWGRFWFFALNALWILTRIRIYLFVFDIQLTTYNTYKFIIADGYQIWTMDIIRIRIQNTFIPCLILFVLFVSLRFVSLHSYGYILVYTSMHI